MKKVYQNGISENVRLRHYVMSLLYQGGSESVRLPTAIQLAEEFGIARSTVLLALKQLREEGYVVGKRGSGVFTNPLAGCLPLHNRKLIGLLLNGGDNFYYGKGKWQGIAELGSAITEAGWNLRPLFNINLERTENLGECLKREALSAVVMLHTDARCALRAAEAVPVILIGHQRGYSAPSIRFSYDAALIQLRKELRFQRPAFLGKQRWVVENNFVPFWNGPRIPLSRKAGGPAPGEIDFKQKLERYLQEERPDVLFSETDLADEVWQTLRVLKQDIPVVCWGPLPDGVEFHGYYFQEPYQAAGRSVVEMLGVLFADGVIRAGNPELPVALVRR